MNDVRGATLEELDGNAWGPPPHDATSVMIDAHRLRQVPIGDLTVGDLRFLLTQQVGIEWLVPVALDRLRDDPLAGDYYPGALLSALLESSSGYWDAHPADLMALWAVREALEDLRADADKLLGRDGWPAFG
jgi:hypothetical protein